jgi:hypothetical protein
MAAERSSRWNAERSAAGEGAGAGTAATSVLASASEVSAVEICMLAGRVWMIR